MNSKNFDRNSKPIRFIRVTDRQPYTQEDCKLYSFLQGPLDAKTRTKIINVLGKVMEAIESGELN